MLPTDDRDEGGACGSIHRAEQITTASDAEGGDELNRAVLATLMRNTMVGPQGIAAGVGDVAVLLGEVCRSIRQLPVEPELLS